MCARACVYDIIFSVYLYAIFPIESNHSAIIQTNNKNHTHDHNSNTYCHKDVDPVKNLLHS